MQIPQSELGGIHPELAARITAGRAAMGDFDREVDTYRESMSAPRPDWEAWAFRFASALAGIISLLERA